jgi:hypothetical protein
MTRSVSGHFADLPALDEEHVRAYAAAVRDAYASAERAAGGIAEQRFRIGGYRILVRSTVESLLSLQTAALEHLAEGAGGPQDLAIHLWDSANGSAQPPSPLAWYTRHRGAGQPPLSAGARFDARGELPAFNTKGVRTGFHVWPHMLRLLDVPQGAAFSWVDDTARLPYYETVTPFVRILAWWMGERGRAIVHAGAVGMASGGVLIAGASGSGKSTAVLACLKDGMEYAGDDHCLVATRPVPQVYGLYATAKLKGNDDVARFPALARFVRNAGRLETEKVSLFLRPCSGVRLATGFPLRALLVPRVTGAAAARLVPVSPSTALALTAPSTVSQMPGTGRASLRLLAELVRRLPGYVLETGPDLASIPAAVRRLLRDGGT